MNPAADAPNTSEFALLVIVPTGRIASITRVHGVALRDPGRYLTDKLIFVQSFVSSLWAHIVSPLIGHKHLF